MSLKKRLWRIVLQLQLMEVEQPPKNDDGLAMLERGEISAEEALERPD